MSLAITYVYSYIALLRPCAPASHNLSGFVLINGGPVSLSQIYPNRAVVGIIEAFYPGALGGTAVADVLFGKYSPGGRMPAVTTYVSSGEISAAIEYGMSTPPGRTYHIASKYTNLPVFIQKFDKYAT